MAVGVVHLLEVVDVEHGQAHGAVEAAAAVHLVLEEVLEVAHVEEAGELVRDRLALNRLVQGGVLDRHRGLRRQVAEQVLLGLGELAAAARDREHAHVVHVGATVDARPQRPGQRLHAVHRRRGGPALLHRLLLARRVEVGEQLGAHVGARSRRRLSRRPRAHPPASGRRRRCRRGASSWGRSARHGRRRPRTPPPPGAPPGRAAPGDRDPRRRPRPRAGSSPPARGACSPPLRSCWRAPATCC